MGSLGALIPLPWAVACYAALSEAANVHPTGDGRTHAQRMADEFFTRITGMPVPGHGATGAAACAAGSGQVGGDGVGDTDVDTDVSARAERRPEPATAGLAVPAPAEPITDPVEAVRAAYRASDRPVVRDQPGASRRDEPHVDAVSGPESSGGPESTSDVATGAGPACQQHAAASPRGPSDRATHGTPESAASEQAAAASTWPTEVRHADHLRPFADGGATDIANGQSLSEDCNYVRTAPGWRAGPDPDGSGAIVVTTPTGHRYRSAAPDVIPGHAGAEAAPRMDIRHRAEAVVEYLLERAG
jgi:hypothetical protein